MKCDSHNTISITVVKLKGLFSIFSQHVKLKGDP